MKKSSYFSSRVVELYIQSGAGILRKICEISATSYYEEKIEMALKTGALPQQLGGSRWN